MSRLLTPTGIVEKNALSSSAPFLWLYEIEIPTSPPTRYRLVRNLETVTWRGLPFSPANVAHGPMTEDAQGTIVTNVLTIQNVTREILAQVDTYGGLGGQTVEVHAVLTNDLASGQSVLSERYSILDVTADERAITAKLGQWNAYRTLVPAELITREHCRFKFRSPRCGYIGSLPTCDNTLTGPDGCETKAVDSTEHPARFGNFPLTPRVNGIGVKS